MNRKDEHLRLAKEQDVKSNGFDRIYFEHDDLPGFSIDDVDLSTEFLGYKVKLPIYMNAMTGGSLISKEVNTFLAALANHFEIPMISGSVSSALKDETLADSFKVIREQHKGIVVSNINPNYGFKGAKRALDLLNADGLSIHLNVIQELIMPEGDRDFSKWEEHIAEIVKHLDKPILVKEVGFGLSPKTILKLQNLGVKYIDISGHGGTSFLEIEARRSKRYYGYLDDLSLDTAYLLQELKEKALDINIYASGGIRNPFDVIKALALGAKACGLAKYFLMLSTLNFEDAVNEFEDFILTLKKIMVILGVRNIEELQKLPYKIK